MISGSSPIFVARNIYETARFYEEVLGFTSTWAYGEPPSFGGASWGKVMIMFSLDPDLVGKVEGHGHWIDVEDVDSLYARHVDNGAQIISPIDDKPWGKREYTVRDLNGYHLRFVGDPSYVSKGSGTLPEGVKIVCRMPTTEEFDRVTRKAFGRSEASAEILQRTWRAILATDKTGEVIGTARIAYDARGWFSIWDVAVLPEWQGCRIGTAMMEAALEIIRTDSPGARVFLFTLKDKFYERLGFTNERLHLRTV